MNALVVPAAQDAVAARAPAAGIWQHCSTRGVPKRDRFDFWRQLPVGTAVERPLGARGDFFGEFRGTATPEGIGYAELDVDPCVCRFGRDNPDVVQVGLIAAGHMHIRYARDGRFAWGAGNGLMLFDCGRPMTTVTSRCELVYVTLPRAAVVAALGGDTIPRGMAVRPLAPSVLKADLTACLRGLQRDPARTAAEVAAAVRTAGALALVALAGVRGAGHRWPQQLDAALYRAARHQLSLHVADPLVTVSAVAAALGCSRAHLYRLFAVRGESVGGVLYALRMQQAAALLRAHPQVAISAVASRCGYGEPAAFGKAFRRRFHMTPGDWRAALAEATGAPA